MSLLLEQANEPPRFLRPVQPYHAPKRASRWFGKATIACGGKEPSDLAREGCIYRGYLLIHGRLCWAVLHVSTCHCNRQSYSYPSAVR